MKKIDYSNSSTIIFKNKNEPKNSAFFRYDADKSRKIVEILYKNIQKNPHISETRIIYHQIAFSLECYLKSALLLEKNSTLKKIKEYRHNLKRICKDINFLKLSKNNMKLILDLDNKLKNKKILYTATLVEEGKDNDFKFYPIKDYLKLLSYIKKEITNKKTQIIKKNE